MKAASLNEIRRQLSTLDAGTLEQVCIRLARYKNENKELLTYLLFEAHDEAAYISGIKLDVDMLFESLPRGNVYFIKKGVRKILRLMNRHLGYAGVHTTELEIRFYFCLKIRSAGVPLQQSTVLQNLYQQQVKKIRQLHSKLEHDLQFDYHDDIHRL